MKYGFALIELIVATLIASMVAGILLAALSQGNRFQLIIDNTIDFSSRISIVTHQLEKDLSGAFIPTQAEPQKDQKKEESPAEETEDQQQQEKKPTEKKEEAGQKGAEKKEQKPIEKIFYSINKSGKFDTLTFITNNPLEVYVGKDVGVVKPKVVRVQYSLKPEAGKKDSYALFRQESMELDLEKYKDVRAYEVIGGIKECTVKFIARIPKKNEKQDQKAAEKKVEYEYKTLTEWVSERKKDAEQKEKEEFPRIPYNVEITLVLWNMQDTREETYTIVCQIPIDFTEPKKEEKKQPEQPARPDKQLEAAGTTDKTGKAGQSQVKVYNRAIIGESRSS